MNEREIYAEALARGTLAERAAFLDGACSADSGLRARIEALLVEHEKLGSFLESPPAAVIAHQLLTTAHQPPDPVGTQIGPYKLLQLIGEGGMGTVYMAEQTHPVRRKVALKIIKPGMDSRQVIVRFEAERQALSLMDHPNIARVLDAGTTDNGGPYFVMELVKGQSITQYCDEKRLTPRERLELLLPVCQAIQHAHQKGVIHRDIKPSNILVAEYDQKAVPKVIDFGVAKAISQPLTEKTMFTGYGQIVGTLEYMSPEQAKVNQLDIDTRSDIYSLGVLMYELLTGTTPFDKRRLRLAAWEEMLRVIREEEPPKPSTRLSDSKDSLPSISAQRHTEPAKLTRLVRGELDWIVMKALDKDRARRYETANGLADDLRRYLNDEPVIASPPSAAYRLKKFARRNKTGMAIGTLIMFFVALLAAGASWAYRDRAVRQAVMQEKSSEAIRQAEDFIKQRRLAEALTKVQRAEELLGNSGSTALLARVRQVRDDAVMLEELNAIPLQKAEAPEKAGLFDVARTNPRYVSAFQEYGIDVAERDPAEGAAQVRKSAIHAELLAGLDAWLQVMRADDPQRARVRAIADQVDDSAWRRTFRAASLSNESQTLKDLAAQEDALAQPPAVLASLGAVLEGKGMWPEAVALLKQAQLRHPADFWINYNLGHVLLFHARPRAIDEAAGYFRAAVAVRPVSAEGHSILGLAHYIKGDDTSAIACYQRAISLNPRYFNTHFLIAMSFQRQGKLDEAFAHYRNATELKPGDPRVFSNIAWMLATAPDASHRDPHRAVETARIAVQLSGEDGKIQNTLGVALYRDGQFREAIAALEKSLALLKNDAVAYNGLFIAMSHWQLGEQENARQWFEKSVQWMDSQEKPDEELKRFSAEAAELLGLAEAAKP